MNIKELLNLKDSLTHIQNEIRKKQGCNEFAFETHLSRKLYGHANKDVIFVKLKLKII
jgi:hypothetical protein